MEFSRKSTAVLTVDTLLFVKKYFSSAKAGICSCERKNYLLCLHSPNFDRQHFCQFIL